MYVENTVILKFDTKIIMVKVFTTLIMHLHLRMYYAYISYINHYACK